MRVSATGGGEWLIMRRFAPWLRRVRPFMLVEITAWLVTGVVLSARRARAA
ncbi:hypothetical protein [Amycolatopsis sp. lyj-112]|uniref:hypothetical protein n=1 Tax=Amycolatopsis sp. lyj-112 TaxID=2789288 RepID=UPI00397ACE71